MDVPSSICSNCYELPGCILHQGKSVTECEEHHIPLYKTMVKNLQPTELKEAPNSVHFAGLCTTCELNTICSLKSEESITFHCEHYQ